jgi:hypothetical protein
MRSYAESGRRLLTWSRDRYDPGLTLTFLKKCSLSQKPKAFKIAALLDKPSRRTIEGDYVGFKIPDEFLVGYSLDTAEKYRNLQFSFCPKSGGVSKVISLITKRTTDGAATATQDHSAWPGSGLPEPRLARRRCRRSASRGLEC